MLKYTSSLECGDGGRVQDARTWLIEGTVAALRNGSVCVDLTQIQQRHSADDSVDLPWPEPAQWLHAVRTSSLAGSPPVLRFLDDLLYLDRYWLEEQHLPTVMATSFARAWCLSFTRAARKSRRSRTSRP